MLHTAYCTIVSTTVCSQQGQEGSKLEDVMNRQIICVTENIALQQLTNTFKKVSGVCVVDGNKRLIGVVSRKDLEKGVSVSSTFRDMSPSQRTLLVWRCQFHTYVMYDGVQAQSLIGRGLCWSLFQSCREPTRAAINP